MAYTLLFAQVPAHVMAAQFGHADPTVKSRVYARAPRAALGVGDVFTQTVKIAVSKPAEQM